MHSNSRNDTVRNWTGKKPNLSHLKISGSDAYAHIPKLFRTKLQAKARKVILVGYQEGTTNYRLFDPGTKRVSVSRDVTFNEKTAYQIESKNFDPVLPEDKDEQADNKIAEAERPADDEGSVDEIPADHAQEEEHPLPPIQHNLRDRSSIKRPARYEANVIEINVPATYQEAITGSDALARV